MAGSNQPEIRIFPILEELSRAAARLFVHQAAQRINEAGSFAAALSGGSTPKRLFQILAQPEHRVEWEHVQLFQVDERCVPPDHPDSNYKMTREALLDHVSIPASNFHRMKAEDEDRDKAAKNYSDEIAQVLKPTAGEFPRFDLVLLGMGPDGHTASLFPGSEAIGERTRWVCPNYSQRLKSFRLTLTYPVLNAARHVVFLVAGADKAETLHRVMSDPPQPSILPAQGIQPAQGVLSWYLDEAAGKLLPH